MDRADLLTVMEWMMPRWTEVAAWEPQEWQAFLDDLEKYAAGQVLTAMHRLWRNGRERAPRAGTVLNMLHELAERPGPDSPQLPPPAEPTVTLGEYVADHFGSWQQMWQLIEEGKLK